MVKKLVKVQLEEGQRFMLIPIGDVQIGAREYDGARFARLIDWIQRQQRDGVKVGIIGMGDYVDQGSTSERAALRSMALHDSTRNALNDAVRGYVGKFADLMAPVSKSIIGLLTGHHNFSLPEGSVDNVLCKMLGCDWLGNGTAQVRLLFPHDLKLDVAAAHGNSSAQTSGGRVNARAKYADTFPGAHLVLVGHDVAKFAYPLSGLDFDSGTVKRYLVGTGSFQQGYMETPHAGYAELAGLRPADMGVAIINIAIEQRFGVWRVDYHVSV